MSSVLYLPFFSVFNYVFIALIVMRFLCHYFGASFRLACDGCCFLLTGLFRDFDFNSSDFVLFIDTGMCVQENVS